MRVTADATDACVPHPRRVGVIVSAVDGSASSWAAFEEALKLACGLGDRVVVVTVWRALQRDFGIEPAASIALPQLLAAERRHAESVLQEAVGRARQEGVTVTTRLETGDPAHEICALAVREGAHLVTVGTQGHGAVRALLVGSVSAAVIRNAPCPVLVARSGTLHPPDSGHGESRMPSTVGHGREGGTQRAPSEGTKTSISEEAP